MNPTMTREDLIAAAESIGMRFPKDVPQEPVAHVYRNEYGTVRIDQQYLPSEDSFPVFAYHPDAQAEIAKRDARIAELLWAVADHITVRGDQALEISRLKGVIAKCEVTLTDLQPALCSYFIEVEETLAAIKEIE